MPATDQFTGNLKTLYVRTRVNVGEYDERDDFVMATAEQVKAHCASCVDHAASIHPVAASRLQETVPWASISNPRTLMASALLHAVASLQPDICEKLGVTPGNISDLKVTMTINGVAVPMKDWFERLDKDLDRRIETEAVRILSEKLTGALEQSVGEASRIVEDFQRSILRACFPNRNSDDAY